MSRSLKLGFVPLTDAAPLIVAQARGFFAAEGLQVELGREASWATVRDKLEVGALDGAHMLAPMAVASTMGLGGKPVPLVVPMVLNRGGAAVVVSRRITGGAERELAAALRRVVALRREQRASRLTFAVVFPYSIHNFLLRRWLTDAGIDPDADVRVTVAPPPRMAELLADGVIEGFCAGEPWGAAAEAAGSGEVAVRAGDLWPRAPDKALAVREGWSERAPQQVHGLVRALSGAAAWAADPENTAELVRLLAMPGHVGVPADLIAARLADVAFAGAEVNAPSDADAVWLVAQMSRWAQLDGPAAARAAQRTFRRDVFEAALRANA